MRTNVIARSLVAAAVIAASAGALAAQGMQNTTGARPVGAAPKGQTISQRDVVIVQVLGEARDKFSGEFIVGLDGSIEYPRLGRIKVEGMTTDEVGKELTTRLSEQLVNPQVQVGLNQVKNKAVFVSGEVRSVGQVGYAGSLTVRQALILSGGITDQASTEATVVRRNSPNDLLTVDLIGLMVGDSRTPDPELQDGDTVIVQKAKPVFIQGPVAAPGQYIVRPGTTVQQLVNLAGGITEKGKSSGLKIERPQADPKKKPQTIEVKDWKTEVVKPGDTVIVPKRIW